MKNVPLSRDHVLYLLDQVLDLPSDFEAFLIDFFAPVSRRRTSAMPRSAVEDLLLSMATLEEVTAALEQAEPTRYQEALRRAANPAAIPSPRQVPDSGAAAIEPVPSPLPAPSHRLVVTELNRAQTRALLHELFIDESALSGFICDFFPRAYRELTSGMGRTERESLLLIHAETGEIVMALRKQFPVQVQAFLLRLP